MLLSLLVCAASAKTSADLVAPYEIDENNKIGYWTLGGSAMVSDDLIMLVPPLQFHKGCAWTNVEIPSTDFKITFDLKIHEGTQGGGFGIWFSDVFGATGFLQGGPTSFKGLALIGSIKEGQGDKLKLELSLIQNKGVKMIDPQALPEPEAVLEVESGTRFLLTVAISGYDLEVGFADRINGREKLLFTKKVFVDLAENYIGITGQCDSFTSRIDIHSISFDLDSHETVDVNRDASFGYQPPSGQYSNPRPSIFRNPYLVLTSKHIQTVDEPGHAAKLDDLFGVIDELNVAAYDVASFKQVNEFVKSTVLPYSAKWQRRTLKLIENVKDARNVVGAAWNFTNDLMSAFNSTLRANAQEANTAIFDLTSLIVENGLSGIDVDGDLATDAKRRVTGGIGKWLISTAVVELLVLVVVFILIQVPSVKNRIIFDAR